MAADDGSLQALRAPLLAGLHALGLETSASQVERLLAYLALIARWNRVYNLTAVRDPAEMLTQHLLDSLSVLPPLAHQRPVVPGRALRVLDVGSGAGLPGVVLAILRADLQVTCVDAVAKKASFVRQVAGELALPNLRAEHARVETLKAAPFDLITSRAFASLADFVHLTRNHLAADGVWMAMKGRAPDDEVAALPTDVRVFLVEPLRVPGLHAQRCLIWMRPRP